MKIIEKWYKKWSVWLLAGFSFLASLEVFLPEVRESLPADWYQYAFILVLVARIIKQANTDD